MENCNINRGFKKLVVWQDAIDLYVLSSKLLTHAPFELKKSFGNCLDACHSINRNISEGYCRKSIKEYLNFLNIALGSSGEFHSSIYSFLKAEQLSNEDFEELDKLHFKLENGLINLIKSLQKKMKDGTWNDSFV
ncbi:MAG: four helix bundle protein [Salinivirgaceae bacterium]|nr:four helix bundle protein [Salinivirgaceae bacterium]